MKIPGPLNTSTAPFGVSSQELRSARKAADLVRSDFELFSADLDHWDGSQWDKDARPHSIQINREALQQQGYPSDYKSVQILADDAGRVLRFEAKKIDGSSTMLDYQKLDGWLHPRFSVNNGTGNSSVVMDDSTGAYKLFQQTGRK